MGNILEMQKDPDPKRIEEIIKNYQALPKELAARLVAEKQHELRRDLKTHINQLNEQARMLAALKASRETVDFISDASRAGIMPVPVRISGPLRAHKFVEFFMRFRNENDALIKRTAEYVSECEKFSFYDAVEGNNFKYLADFGREMFRSGLAKMPHEKTYFECGIRIGECDAVLAMWGGHDDSDIWFYLSRDYGVSWAPGGAINMETGKAVPYDEEERVMAGFSEALGGVFYACMALLMSKSTKQEMEIAGESANRKRIKAGKIPLYSHRVVTINPDCRGGGGRGGSHASPRLHWRRGHIRRYKTGCEIWIAPTLVGSADRGIITHEYRVKSPTA